MNSRATDPVDESLRAAAERVFAAIAARDLEALRRELAEDFVHTSIGGDEQDRDAFLAAIRDMPLRILEIHGEGLRTRVVGEVALLSGVQRARVALPDGRVVTARTAFVDAFVSDGDRWRLRQACSVELAGESPE